MSNIDLTATRPSILRYKILISYLLLGLWNPYGDFSARREGAIDADNQNLKQKPNGYERLKAVFLSQTLAIPPLGNLETCLSPKV